MVILPEHVVFDLETNADRAHPSEHEIIQIGAVLVSGNEEVRKFETLVRPNRRLPARITELTGLEYGDLEHAPLLEDVLPRFLEWVGNRPLIAHNGFGYDFLVLDAVTAEFGLSAPTGPRLDTLELAHLVYPRAGSGMVRGVDGEHPPAGRTLDDLAALVGRPARDKHDALGDARITSAVMRGLLDQLNLPAPARRLQRWILGRTAHPWTAFVDPVGEPVSLDDVVPETSIPEPVAPTGTLDIAALLHLFKAGGSLMTDGRTPRPQQAEMAQLVATALGTPGIRQMIEAPTGTGKTLAYLVPAIEAARASGRVSVVAPHSRVLQDQILQTLEDLESPLPRFSTVVLKGRQNYVSLKALQGELDWLADDTDRASADDTTTMALAILCGWVAETPSGDWADLRTAAIEVRLGALSQLRWRLRVDARPGPASDRLDELDFYRRALARLGTAHVAVLNHALLAASPALERRGFNLLIDEAHNLEDSVTAASTREVSVQQLDMLCDALWDPASRRGLIARLSAAMDTGFGDGAIETGREAVAAIRLALRRLTEPLIEHVRNRTGVTREQAARYGVAHRVVRGADRRHPSYRRVEDAGRSLRDSLRGAASALDDLTVPSRLKGRYRAHALEDEKARLGREARNAAELVDAVLWGEAQLRLIDDDLDDDLAQWINIVDVSFEAGRIDGATGVDPAASAAGEWRWALRRQPSAWPCRCGRCVR